MGVFVKVFLLGFLYLGIESVFTRFDVKHVSSSLWKPQEAINGQRYFKVPFIVVLKKFEVVVVRYCWGVISKHYLLNQE